VSFASPGYLLALLLMPAAAWLYVRHQRRRALAMEQFASAPLLASVAPARPGWRRHLPMAFFAVAVAILIVALARPQATVAVPVEQASVVLATDQSGSMDATDVKPSRLAAARHAADTFLKKVPSRFRVGAVAFNQHAQLIQSLTTDRDAVREALAGVKPSGGTATGEGLATALRALTAGTPKGQRRPPGAIILLSDGSSTSGRDPIAVARQAKKLQIRVYTVALGTPSGTIRVPTAGGGTQVRPVPPDPGSLQRIAQASGGKAYTAADTGQLDAVYKQLGSRVAKRNQPREVTAAFAGGALVLILGGALFSLRWFARPA
jgi:Ca-activated chloride channel family protein